MAAISATIAAVGVGLAATGTVMNYRGQKKASEMQSQAINEQAEAEKLRRKQMELDAARRRREIVREALRARSLALATATNQGAAESSGLQGGYGQISGRAGVNTLGVNQNEEIGGDIFERNMNASNFMRQSASWGTYAAMGNGLSSLGGALVKNQGTIDRVGNYFFGSDDAPNAGGSGKSSNNSGFTGVGTYPY